jgi:hypothetical protein
VRQAQLQHCLIQVPLERERRPVSILLVLVLVLVLEQEQELQQAYLNLPAACSIPRLKLEERLPQRLSAST